MNTSMRKHSCTHFCVGFGSEPRSQPCGFKWKCGRGRQQLLAQPQRAKQASQLHRQWRESHVHPQGAARERRSAARRTGEGRGAEVGRRSRRTGKPKDEPHRANEVPRQRKKGGAQVLQANSCGRTQTRRQAGLKARQSGLQIPIKGREIPPPSSPPM